MSFVKDDMTMTLWQAYNNYNKEFNKLLKDNSKVDYFILLQADFKKIIQRIKKRGREEEKDVDIKYWEDMYNQYYNNSLIKEYIKTNVNKLIVINTNNSNIDKIVYKIIKKISL